MLDDITIDFYIGHIKEQINEAEKAYSLILSNLSNHDILFSSIHHYIIHVSNVVKLIQPKVENDNDFKKYRSASIRNRYPLVPDIRPKDIRIRNDFEHFDERIDYWVINSKNHSYLDRNIGDCPPENVIGGLDSKDSFRWFDNNKLVLYFSGEKYNLEKLYEYIQNVKKSLS